MALVKRLQRTVDYATSLGHVSYESLRFHFDVVVVRLFGDELKREKRISVTLERREKLLITTPTPVENGVACVEQTLSVGATMYRKPDQDHFQSKKYKLAIKKGSKSSKIVSKTIIDFANYVRVDGAPRAEELLLSDGTRIVLKIYTHLRSRDVERPRPNSSGSFVTPYTSDASETSSVGKDDLDSVLELDALDLDTTGIFRRGFMKHMSLIRKGSSGIEDLYEARGSLLSSNRNTGTSTPDGLIHKRSQESVWMTQRGSGGDIHKNSVESSSRKKSSEAPPRRREYRTSDQSSKELVQLQEEIANMTNKLEEITKDRDEWIEKHRKLEKELMELKQETDETVYEMGSLETENERLKDEVAEIKATMDREPEVEEIVEELKMVKMALAVANSERDEAQYFLRRHITR